MKVKELAAKKKTFEKLLLESIDKALGSLGESARQSIYFHLQSKFKITKQEIPQRLEAFEDGLEKIFGLDAQFIEILIMKNLYSKIGHPLEWKEDRPLAFIEYVKTAKQSFLKRSKECQ